MVAYALPPLYSGAGTQALRLARTLHTHHGIDVTILAARHTPELLAAEDVDGVAVRRLSVLSGSLRRPIFGLQVTRYLLEQSRRYDLVHIHGAYWRIWPILQILRFTHLKSVVKLTQMGTDDPQTIRQRPLGSVLLRALSLADAVVSTSGDLTSSYAATSLPEERLVKIPNGVDTAAFAPVDSNTQEMYRRRLGLPTQGALIIFTGKVGHRKGVDRLLTAWEEVVKDHPTAQLLLLGPIGEDDPLRPDQRPIRPWLADVPNVLAPGQQPNPQEYLKAADIFVLPSRREGLSNALLEAMATGLPCVASDIGANREVLKAGANGLLFDPDDVGALTKALRSLIQDTKCRRVLGQQARETVKVAFSLESVAEAYASLYRRLLSHAEDD